MDVINWKRCDLCDINFKKQRDYNNHILTNKHIKKNLGITNNKCPSCNYSSDNKSNLQRHIKTNHPEVLEKIKIKLDKLDDPTIPKLVMKEYVILKDNLGIVYSLTLGIKFRINNLRTRLYAEHEQEVIDAKLNFKKKVSEYNECLKKIKDIESKYPTILSKYTPMKKPNSDYIEEDYDEEERINKEKKDKEENDLKHNKLEELKNEIQSLYDKLKTRDFEDLEKHKLLIDKKEKEYKSFLSNNFKNDV